MWCPSEFFVTCSTWTSFFNIVQVFHVFQISCLLKFEKKKITIFVILEKEKCYIKERNLR